MARLLLAGFLFGNLFSILYSLAGGVLSFIVMCLLKKTGRFHVISVSVTGGISHNIGQLIAAAFVVETYDIFYYMPFLLIAGVATGFVIGMLAQEFILRFEKQFHF